LLGKDALEWKKLCRKVDVERTTSESEVSKSAISTGGIEKTLALASAVSIATSGQESP
jgi:hypothetical protein